MVFKPFVFLLAQLVCVGTTQDASSFDKVVVVGGGLAGLSAAVELAKRGISVVIIEGEKNLGGNSAKASSGINGCNTSTQKNLNVQDSSDLFYADTVNAGDQKNNPTLVDHLVHQSAAAIDFLLQMGIPLTGLTLCGGHQIKRTHWFPSPKEGKPTPVGIGIIRGVQSEIIKLKEEGNPIEILTNTKVVSLLHENSNGGVKKITGIKLKREDGQEDTVYAKSVILTTGGFSNDHESDSLLKEFAPSVLHYPTTNGAFAIGSGVKMARELGAQLVDMDKVQIHPTGFVDPKDPSAYTKFLAAEALRGSGALMLDQKGHRFANELGRRDYLTSRILEHCELNSEAKAHTAFLLMNDKSIDLFGWPAFNFYWKIKGFFKKYESVKDFADESSMNFEEMKKVLEQYNLFVNKVSDGPDEFGKTTFPIPFLPSEPLYVATITPSIHYTMGGLKIDQNAQVLGENDKIIEGLYAAGEVTGGVHGSNRLGGNSLLECVVFGRTAGISASKLFPKEGHGSEL